MSLCVTRAAVFGLSSLSAWLMFMAGAIIVIIILYFAFSFLSIDFLPATSKPYKLLQIFFKVTISQMDYNKYKVEDVYLLWYDFAKVGITGRR